MRYTRDPRVYKHVYYIANFSSSIYVDSYIRRQYLAIAHIPGS